ncbi:MAG: hypothetical protein IJI21_05570 [Clostridia bacterium]|nr:hypothetical protein [Clostridia bacterium]
MDTVSVEFHDRSRDRTVDVQIPLFLTAGELVAALTHAYDLPINLEDPAQVYMRAENPIAFLAGQQTLEQLGIANGTRIFFEPRH